MATTHGPWELGKEKDMVSLSQLLGRKQASPKKPAKPSSSDKIQGATASLVVVDDAPDSNYDPYYDMNGSQNAYASNQAQLANQAAQYQAMNNRAVAGALVRVNGQLGYWDVAPDGSKRFIVLPNSPPNVAPGQFVPFVGGNNLGNLLPHQVPTPVGGVWSYATDNSSAVPPQPADGVSHIDPLLKSIEETRKFTESPFANDPVASKMFFEVGQKPQCIFMSATNNHNVELFTAEGYLWMRLTDDDGNLMQVRLSPKEAERMLEAAGNRYDPDPNPTPCDTEPDSE